MRTVTTLLIFLTACYGRGDQCLNSEELLALNKGIACQQLQNPVDCHDFSEYLDFMWTKKDLRESRKFDNVDSHFVELAAITGFVATVANSRVREFIALGEKIDRVEDALVRVQNSRASQATKAIALEKVLRPLLATKLFQALGNVPQNVTQSRIADFTKDLVKKAGNIPGSRSSGRAALTAGKWGLKGVQGLSAWPVTAALLLYQFESYIVEKKEEKSGCKTRNRNAFPYICLKEDCWHHHTTCNKSFNFIATLPPHKQEEELNKDTRLCDYMREHLQIVQFRKDSVKLESCKEDGRVKFKLERFHPHNLEVSGPSGWTPPNGSAGFNINVATRVGSDLRSPNNSVVQISPPLRHHLHNIEALKYNFDEQGNLLDVAMNKPGRIHRDSAGKPIHIPWLHRRNKAQIEKIISPRDDVGLFAGLKQGGWDAESRWVFEQQFLLNGQLSQAYSEVMKCCPDVGKCQLDWETGSQSRPSKQDVVQ